MSLIDRMYQGQELPASTKPEKVRQIHDFFAVRLSEEMQKRHIWLAACTVAVNAGMWRGNRFRKRRRKLLELINKCRTFLDLPTFEFERGWENANIIDGYGAHSLWQQRSLETHRHHSACSSFSVLPLHQMTATVNLFVAHH